MIQHQKRNFKLYGRYIEYWTIGENDKYQVWPDAKKEDTGISKMPAIPEEMEHELDDLVKEKFSELDVKTNDKIFEEQEKILPKDDEIKKIEDVETSKMLAIPEEMEHEMDNEIVTEELSESDVKKHVQIFYESDEILRKKDTQTSKMPAISANQGMYKDRVENDRIFFEIPALVFLEIKINNIYFPSLFPAEFSNSQNERALNSNYFFLLSFTTLLIYKYPDYDIMDKEFSWDIFRIQK